MRDDYRDALTLQLLTASRISEVVEMRWSEADLAAGTITIPEERSKNGDEHLIILSEPPKAILEKRRQWKAPADVYVFPSPSKRGQPLRSDLVQHTLATNREKLGLGPRFTSHNVRHVFATWAANEQVKTVVVDRCRAHVVAKGIGCGSFRTTRSNGETAS
jgi:integrase